MLDTPRNPMSLLAIGAICALIGGIAGWGVQYATSDRLIHDYIVSHPDVLPEAMANLHQQDDTRQLAGMRGDIEKPWPGAVLGNPNGKQILVEFADYACGYCRRSVADIEQLTASHPDLKVVMRELPILTPASTDAAKMALAAAAQGRYAAFHKAMFEIGHPDAGTIAQAAAAAGLDMARARQTIADPATEAEIERNLEFARRLGFAGTPSWIAGDRLLSGALGAEAIARALDRKG
jgi:protein-disulfide isomerase